MRTRWLFALITLFAISFVPTQFAAAQSLCPPGFTSLCPSGSGAPPSNLVGNIVTILLILGVLLALFFLLWGGIRWILSGGDKAKIAQARETIIHAIVGLIIAFLAYFIVSFLLRIFTGQGLGTMTIPTLL